MQFCGNKTYLCVWANSTTFLRNVAVTHPTTFCHTPAHLTQPTTSRHTPAHLTHPTTFCHIQHTWHTQLHSVTPQHTWHTQIHSVTSSTPDTPNYILSHPSTPDTPNHIPSHPTTPESTNIPLWQTKISLTALFISLHYFCLYFVPVFFHSFPSHVTFLSLMNYLQ